MAKRVIKVAAPRHKASAATFRPPNSMVEAFAALQSGFAREGRAI
jgi:hypothetical protein